MYYKACWSTWASGVQMGFAATQGFYGPNDPKTMRMASRGQTFVSHGASSGATRGGVGGGRAAPEGRARRAHGPDGFLGENRPGIVVVVPSWGQRCGVAEYTRFLVDELRGQGFAAEVARGQEAEVLNLVRRGGFRVVHVQFEYQLFKPASLWHLVRQFKARGLCVIATVHDFLPGQVAANNLIRDEFSEVIVHSARLRDELSRIGVSPERIHVIPMGCPRVALGDEGATRAALGVGPGPAIGYFGFALPQKGIIELAVAAKALRETVYPQLKVFAFAAPAFFGSGYAAELAAFLTGAGLADGFVLRTDYLPVQDVANALHAMDINVLPYKEMAYVGTSSAVRVLMSAEKPIITTDIPYFDDLDGEVYKIPSADPAHIAEAVLHLMANPAKREDMVYRIRRYVEANNWTQVARRHARLYVHLAATPAGAGPWGSGAGDEAAGRTAGGWEEPAGGAWNGNGEPRVAAVPDEVWARVVRRFGKRG
ncbi:MAG: glycosyltransferase [Betaproteobacteria bacterium]